MPPKTDRNTDPAETVQVPAPTYRIAGTPEKGFYRAGRHWPREGVEVNRADFTDAEWSALEGEPRLNIRVLVPQ